MLERFLVVMGPKMRLFEAFSLENKLFEVNSWIALRTSFLRLFESVGAVFDVPGLQIGDYWVAK